ncbi:palmitoyltransferase AKR1, partial [Pisolithus tinctorius]
QKGKPTAKVDTEQVSAMNLSFIRLTQPVAVQNNLSALRCRGDLAAIRELVESGKATINDRDSQNVTPLHWAPINKQLATCHYLIVQGAEVDAVKNPNFTDTQGYNALHLVTHSSSIMPLLYLLHQPINVDSRDMQGHMPLMWAAYQGDALSVDLLLKHGANPNLKDDVGLSPLHWAVVRGNRAILRRLVEIGADIHAKDAEGRTPRDMAVELKSFGAWKRSMEEGGMNEFGVKKAKPLSERNTRIAIFVLPALFLYIIFTTLSILPWYTGMVLAMAEFFALHHILTHVLLTKGSYVKTLTIMLDPSTCPRPVNDGELKAIIEDLASEGQLNGQTFCIQCMAKKPLCSKHCHMCDQCVARSDCHFSSNNHRPFLMFVTTLVAGIILFDYLTYEFYASATAPDNISADCSPIFCVPAAIDSFLHSVSLWSTLQLTWTSVLLVTQFWEVAHQLATLKVSCRATGIQMGHGHHHAVNNDRGDEESEGNGGPKHRHHHVGLCKVLLVPGTCGAFLLNLVGLNRFTHGCAAHGLVLRSSSARAWNPFDLGLEVGLDYGQVYNVPPEGFEERKRKRDAEGGEFEHGHHSGSRSKSLLAKLGLRMTTSSSRRCYEPLSQV